MGRSELVRIRLDLLPAPMFCPFRGRLKMESDSHGDGAMVLPMEYVVATRMHRRSTQVTTTQPVAENVSIIAQQLPLISTLPLSGRRVCGRLWSVGEGPFPTAVSEVLSFHFAGVSSRPSVRQQKWNEAGRNSFTAGGHGMMAR